jgi:hypothetical protein
MSSTSPLPSSATLQTRLVSWPVLTLSIAFYLAINFLVIFVLFPTGVLRVLARPTGGLITATLMANVILLVVVIGLLRWKSRLRAVDFGLGLDGVLVGAALTVLLWASLNAFQALWGLRVDAYVETNSDWSELGATGTVGIFLAQLLGNALFEEVMFRGVLFEQMRERCLISGMGARRSLLLALIISQALFALIHVPLRLSSGLPLGALPGELTVLFGLGVLLALLYWRTGNLYVCVGVHALSNAPLLVVKQQVDISSNGMTAAMAAIVIILLWSRLRK